MDLSTEAQTAAMREAFARTMAEMPENIRDAICSDEKVKTIAAGLFSMGFARGQMHGVNMASKIIKGENT